MTYKNKILIDLYIIFLISPLFMHYAHATTGEVLLHQKISDLEGNFTGILTDGDGFGADIALLGDINNDGLNEIAVGAVEDDEGAVWILSLNFDGTVQSTLTKIGDGTGGFTGALDAGDLFGEKVVSLGDLDGDGVTDIAVGAHRDDDGGSDRGAVWILFLNTNGTVKAEQKISDTAGNFGGTLDNSDDFGIGLTALGDVDGDTIVDLAVGAYRDDDGAGNTGAVWILFLNANGTVKSHQKISATQGGFLGVIDSDDRFGVSVAGLGYLDADGVPDVAVGAGQDDDGATNAGAVWILFLNADGTVKAETKISNTQGNFDGILNDNDIFGWIMGTLGDLDEDGVVDLAVSALADNDGGTDRGAVWILFLNTNGTVKAEQKISDTAGNFGGMLDDNDRFGFGVGALGDLDFDGALDLAVGAVNDDDGGTNRGAVWILFLQGPTTTFSCVGFEPPLDTGPVAVKGKNRALPLKAELFDEEGNPVTDTSLIALPIVQVFFDSGLGDPPVDVTDDALPAGQGTEGNQFVFSGSKWQFNLKTKNYSAPGTYTVFMDSGDDTEYVIDPMCSVDFVVY